VSFPAPASPQESMNDREPVYATAIHAGISGKKRNGTISSRGQDRVPGIDRAAIGSIGDQLSIRVASDTNLAALNPTPGTVRLLNIDGLPPEQAWLWGDVRLGPTAVFPKGPQCVFYGKKRPAGGFLLWHDVDPNANKVRNYDSPWAVMNFECPTEKRGRA